MTEWTEKRFKSIKATPNLLALKCRHSRAEKRYNSKIAGKARWVDVEDTTSVNCTAACILGFDTQGNAIRLTRMMLCQKALRRRLKHVNEEY